MTGSPAGGTLLKMSKAKKSVDTLPDAPERDLLPAEISVSAKPVESEKPEALVSKRNLSLERAVEFLETQKRNKCAEVSEVATVKAGIPLRNADGSYQMKDGVPVIEQRLILKRTEIEMNFDSRIDKLKADVARQMAG